jgi:SAM-dependent methyltransferase
MLYFKHSELVNKYHVSLKTVHNWIDAAKQGKLELELIEKNSRTYIADNISNLVALNKLAEKGKKYRNARFHKLIAPKAEFYEIFSRRQILDIISNLTIHREIPRQYNYFDKGANNWENLLKQQAGESNPNTLSSTIDLLHTNLESIKRLVGKNKKVNVIDIGVGNAMPSRELLGYLHDLGILHRYIAVDISESMLDIARRNITKWFDDNIVFEGYVRDITYERFDDLIVDDMLNKDADDTINLVLFLGLTPVNFRSFSDALKVIYGSMVEGDLLIYNGKPDTEDSRRYFNIDKELGPNSLSPHYSFMLDMLGIDKTLYDVEMGYSTKRRMRFIRVVLNTALTIQFKFDGLERNVQLEKGEALLLLRILHMSALETASKFEDAGFALLHSSMTENRGLFMEILGIDTRSENADLV